MTMNDRYQQELERFTQAGQAHVFKFWEELNDDNRVLLLNDVSQIDLSQVKRMFESVEQAANAEQTKITPFEAVVDLNKSTDDDVKRWYDTGLTSVRNGELAIVLLAGGQGTRLGFNKPKGMYDMQLPSRKTLFHLQAERIKKLAEISGASADDDGRYSIVWYIMTSPFTHDDTVAYFTEQQNFGLHVRFFQQGTLPCLTGEGKIILADKHKVARAPNGNGGLYDGLKSSGALDEMVASGVRYVHAYCVDNIIVKVGHPEFVGFCIDQQSDCCNKVVRKRSPEEPVGAMCCRDGRPSVIEYSEISKEMRELVDDTTGELTYGAGNIANHVFSIDFLQLAAESSLPFHFARKKIPHVTDDGQVVKPHAPNGVKLEMFVFDVFAMSKKMTALAVPRMGEFSPLKNAPGSASDCPETCRRDLSEYHISLVEKAGGKVVRNDNDAILEVSPMLSYDGEGLQARVDGKTIELPAHLQP